MACRQKAAPYGLTFGDMKWLSNSRMSLEAAEFARDKGAYDAFHHEAFKAYFTDGIDIGNMQELLSIAERLDLNTTELESALKDGTFTERVKQGSEKAKQLGVTAVPSFFIEDLPVITGAVSEERFREALDSLSKRTPLA